MPQVNPSVLTWARETAGLTRDEAAQKLQLRRARGMEPAERLAALESGDDQPTRSQLARMADKYRRPLIAFYLEAPPRPSAVGTDFRTLRGETTAREDALVRTLVREAIARQGIVRDLLDGDADEVAFVGAVTLSDGIAAALRAVQGVMGATGAEQRPSFDDLREAVETAGVFVVLQGDLGSYHTALDTNAFRGFVLADRLAPFIVINSNDARPAWSFTLLHELVHLLLGQTGISGADGDAEVERFCDDVASEWLLPASAIDHVAASMPIESDQSDDWLVDAISGLVEDWPVSRALVAYRLHRAGLIDRTRYRRLAAVFYRAWKGARKLGVSGGGGPNYYVVKRHRVGKALVGLVERGLGERTLATTRAAVVLGVKPAQVGPLLGMTPSASAARALPA